MSRAGASLGTVSSRANASIAADGLRGFYARHCSGVSIILAAMVPWPRNA